MMMTHQQQPDAANVPKNWANAILHARIEIGDAVLMDADIPNAEPMRSAYLTLRVESAEASPSFKALNESKEDRVVTTPAMPRNIHVRLSIFEISDCLP